MSRWRAEVWGRMVALVGRRKWLILLGPALLVGLLVAFGLNRNSELQYFTAQVERGEIRDEVDATGTVNPVVTVQVGSQVSGTIAKLFADFNSRVHQGEVIALIDPALFQGALLQATADWDNAKANLTAAQANVDKAKATLVQAKADYERTARLAKEDVLTQQQLELAKANYDAAVASVDAAAASVTQAEAQVSQKAAAVSVARTNLGYTVIRSPINGTVVARNVDVGQTVAASLQAPTIFTIAQDLTKMQVYAKVDESDVGRIKVNRPVTFKVDAFPKDTFRGAVSQIRMNPTTVQNVVTYDVIVDFANPDLKLFPGMTAYVTIPVATAENALKLPNAALRYRPPMPPEAIQALYQQYGIATVERQRKSVAGGGGEGGGAAGPSREPRSDQAVVWKLHSDRTLEPVKVALGITDHAYTEVTRPITGALREGDDVVTGSVRMKTQPPGGQVIRR
ncbi:MAG TPA: efflux RND transporter periplasmic adaptor subunit [Gemmatimonadales bacterium]|nr:efflux RND transporter periplasmic adaptor subunit [Gemmatimonadales bacterium]